MGGAGYEPSADELIDVLKNLENLAAANPGLYRTIVEQIQGKCHQINGPFLHFVYTCVVRQKKKCEDLHSDYDLKSFFNVLMTPPS